MLEGTAISIIGKAQKGVVYIFLDYIHEIEDIYLENVDNHEILNIDIDMLLPERDTSIPHRIEIRDTERPNDRTNERPTSLLPGTKWQLWINRLKTNTFTILGTEPPLCIYNSCCGYKSHRLENGTMDIDDKTLRRMCKEEYDVMVHMGDQIYADTIFEEWEYSPLCDKQNSSLWISKYRQCYRDVFGSIAFKKIFSKGIHIMIADDHDQKFYNDKHEMHGVITRTNIAVASRITMFEYQKQLWFDNVELTAIQNGTLSPNLTLRFRDMNLVVMDTRYSNIYHHDPENPFMSEPQMKYLDHELNRDEKNIVVTSVPILANTKIGSWFKNKVDVMETDDSTYCNNINNALKVLEMLSDHDGQSANILVSGDLHHASKTDLYKDGQFVCRQYITSGLTDGSVASKSNGRLFRLFSCCFDMYRLNGFIGRNIETNFRKNYLIMERCGRFRFVLD